MSGLSQFARAWFDWTVAASWQIGLLVCLIGMLTYLLRDASPRLRYGLWMLVLLKAILPPTIAAFWGVGAWGVAPVVKYDWPIVTADRATHSDEATGVTPRVLDGRGGGDHALRRPGTRQNRLPGARSGRATQTAQILDGFEGPLLLAWAAGCLILWLAVAWRYRRLMGLTRSMRRIDEGPARVELERLAAQFSPRTVPELYATEQATSPMLIGVLNPKIVLPESILKRLDPEELRMVLAHELVHWRRYDTWVGWLQVFVQGVFWFHPLVWLANARIRHERECACDETVLREGQCDSDGYGETIIRVLTASRGRSLVMANMVGVFERGSSLQTRLEEIMSFDPTRRRFNWLSRVALVVAAFVLLPMAIPNVQADNAGVASTAGAASEQTPDDVYSGRVKTNWPTIVATTPKIGATDVDPNLKAISVTFDRDMDVGGYSWTGSGPAHPPSPPGVTPVWVNKRTCELPVQLKKATFYRVGINSTSFQNFRSALGVPAPTSAIYFTTTGATRGVTSRVRVPKVVEMSPENGATGVDPGLKMIRVKFDMPMSIGSHSWTGDGPTFPTIPAGKTARWSPDGKTAMLPVELQPGTQYELGLNSVHHKNFISKWGVPLEPVHYQFRTAGEAPAVTADDAPPADRAGPPRIVKMVPENGAADVDPGLTEIQVTFDRPMAAGFSWTGGGEQFPTIAAGQKPSWSADKKTCKLPVQLKPNWQYRLGLNSVSFKNFASADGVPLEPVVYQFQTRAGN